VAQINPPGNSVVEHNSGYLYADDVNVWGWFFNTDTPNMGDSVQLTQLSHNLCLFDTIAFGGNNITSIGLDPLNSTMYFIYQTRTSISRSAYDGTRIVHFPYNLTGDAQLLVDYNRNKVILLSSIGGQTFDIYDLTTNASITATLAGPITGGLALDINSGKIYAAIQNMVVSYDPANAATATVYTNNDYTIRGITLDSQYGLLFIAADRASFKDSQLLVIPISLPGGTISGSPSVLTPTQVGKFVSMTNAHCTIIGCGQCGAIRPGFITGSAPMIIYSMTLIALFVFMV